MLWYRLQSELGVCLLNQLDVVVNCGLDPVSFHAMATTCDRLNRDSCDSRHHQKQNASSDDHFHQGEALISAPWRLGDVAVAVEMDHVQKRWN